MNTTEDIKTNTIARTPKSRCSTLADYPLDKYGESRHMLHKLDIKGLFAWPHVIKGGIHGLDHNSRQFRCEELRATRAAKRLMDELGFGPTRVNSDHDCSGKWFCSYADIIHVDAVYCYAIVKTSHGRDV